MPENQKRSILMKGYCTSCDKPVGVEVEEPAPIVQMKTEPCKCGVDSDSRVAKSWATAVGFVVCTFFLSMMGSCIGNQYFTTQQVKTVKGEYKVEEAGKDYPKDGGRPPDWNTPNFRAAPIEKPKAEEKK